MRFIDRFGKIMKCTHCRRNAVSLFLSVDSMNEITSVCGQHKDESVINFIEYVMRQDLILELMEIRE